MAAHKPSQADEAHIATAEYWREQRAASERIVKLREARLALTKADAAKPKRKKRPQSKKDLEQPAGNLCLLKIPTGPRKALSR